MEKIVDPGKREEILAAAQRPIFALFDNMLRQGYGVDACEFRAGGEVIKVTIQRHKLQGGSDGI